MRCAAGKLVDVFLRIAGSQIDAFQRARDPVLPLAAGWRSIEQMERLGDQTIHPVAGVEAAIGVLKHHLHPAAHRARHLRLSAHFLPADRYGATLHAFKRQNCARGAPP